MKIGISACLLGDKVRFDGKDKRNEKLIKLLKNHEIIKICPEIESGFPIPHLGNGIFTQICIDNNKKIYTDEDIDLLTKLLK